MRKRTSDGFWLYNSLTLSTKSADGGTTIEVFDMYVFKDIVHIVNAENKIGT